MRSTNREHAFRAIVVLGVAAIVVALFGLPGAKRYGICRVRLATPQALETLQRSGFDIVALEPHCFGESESHADVLVNRKEFRRLEDLGLAPKWRVRDIAEQQEAELKSAALAPQSSAPPNFGAGAMGGYYTLSEIEALLDHYAQNYASIVAPKIVIGTSHEGRPIHALKISDHPGSTEPEPRIVLDSLQHAREPTSMQTLIFLLHRIVTSYGVDPEITALVDSREIWFVPCVNPDGYVYNEVTNPGGGGLWRKNRHGFTNCVGVDLNRNYPFQWGQDDLGSSSDPCSDAYRGPAALSEPESVALENLSHAQHISMAISLHAHGRQMMHPYGNALVAPENDALYDAHGDALAEVNEYAQGTIADTVGFANGNYVDHCHAVLGAEAWAFEIGTAFWPSLSEMFDAAETNSRALMELIAFAGSDVRAQSLEVVEVTGNGDGFPDPGETVEVRVKIRNVGRQATVTGVNLELIPSVPEVTIVQAQANGGALSSQANAILGTGQLRLTLAPTLVAGQRIALEFRTDFDGRITLASLEFVLGKPRRIGIDECEQDLGWRLGVMGDQALTGKWVRSDPKLVMQGLEIAQPEDDTSEFGVNAFITGNGGTAPGQDDVDDGETTLLSPRFDLSAAVDPRLRYQRFYWCSKANHPLRVDLSNDDGTTWVNAETVGGRPNEWRAIELRITDFVVPTKNMRVRFIAEDADNSAVVEAAIDDITIVDYGTRPHILVMGRPRSGGQVEVQVAGRPQKQAWLFVSLVPGNVTVAGLDGPFLLDVNAAAFAGSTVLPNDGFARIPAIVPSNPAFVGLDVWLQTIVLDSLPTASNATRVKLEVP